MQTRYNSVKAGLRMDTGATGAHGEAIDASKTMPNEWMLWVRDENDHEAMVELDIAAIYELREWCTSVMVDEGHERYERVAVST